jgi:predicted membrane-bound spermidine synthase
MKPISRQTLHFIIGLLFVISGGLGLVYQIVWFKYLSLFLGNTTYAQTIVLATFMGGLAIGSAWWGRKADRTRRPLRLYALLELGVGAYCLLYPKFLELLKSVFVSIVISAQLPSDGTAVLLLKLLTSICSLLIPTILMGGTLPILVRFISRRLEESGRNIAVLYFLNSFGAIIGSLLAGFFFIRILGLSITVYSAGIGSLLIGGSALLLSVWRISSKRMKVEGIKELEMSFSRREIIIAISTAGISGLAAMIYEVTWVRLLIPVLGSSTYSFSLMLIAFISGITIGSYIVSILIQRIKNLSSLLGLCQIGVVFSILVTLPLYARIPYEFWRAGSILSRSDVTYPIYLTIQFLFCFILMIIPTIFLGMSLPVATRIASRGINVLGKSVGNVFAVNTLGTVIGSLLAGLILIPLIGVKHTIEVGIGCNLFNGILILFFTNAVPRRKAFAVLSVSVIVVTMYFVLVPNWNRGAMLFGVFRRIHSNIQLPANYSEFERIIRNANEILYYKEGTSATVGVTEGGGQRVLVVNGKPDASSKGDLPTQLLCGQLPCLLHKNPQNVLVVGLGSGVTVGSVLTHPIKRVDCVEIAPEIVEASSLFNEVNRRPFDDPRTNLFIEDALAYLKITPRMYDVIINEPTNPWIAGVGNLFTTEFFVACKRRMNTGGCMVQWFHLYEMNDELFKMIVRTFQSSFKYVSIWQPLTADVIMIGSEQPITIDYDKINAAMNVKEIQDDLKRISIPDAATFLSLEMLSPKSVMRYIGVGDLNTEDHPRLEYNAPGAFFANTDVTQIVRFDERMRCDSVAVQLKIRMDKKLVTDNELRNIGFYHTNHSSSNLRFGYAILHELYMKHQKDAQILERLVKTADLLKLSEASLFYHKKLAELQPTNPRALSDYAMNKYFSERSRTTILTPINTKESEDLLNKSITLVDDTVDRYRLQLANLYYGIQQYAKAIEQYERVIEIHKIRNGDLNIRDDEVLMQIAYSYSRLNRYGKAFSFAIKAVNVNPKNEAARDMVYEIWTKGMNPAVNK